MAECSEISLLIGPFEDGELEPHEMQEVARHLAICSSCELILNEYSQVGRELRAITALPSLDGFAQGVLNRIAAVRVPIRQRIASWFDRFAGDISGTLAMGAIAAAVAVVTAIIVTPYTQQRIRNQTSSIASIEAGNVGRIEGPLAPADLAATAPPVFEGKPERPSITTVAAGDSEAIISRLESEIPSVALWSEPKNDTTVIWLPEQQQ